MTKKNNYDESKEPSPIIQILKYVRERYAPEKRTVHVGLKSGKNIVTAAHNILRSADDYYIVVKSQGSRWSIPCENVEYMCVVNKQPEKARV
jgi:hypothetical protein